MLVRQNKINSAMESDEASRERKQGYKNVQKKTATERVLALTLQFIRLWLCITRADVT